MAKKRPKKPPSCSIIGPHPESDKPGAQGVGIEEVKGLPICFFDWTSFGGEADEPTSVTVQEWDGNDWKVVEVVGYKGRKVADALPLDNKIFRGHFKGERVLTVFKPADKA
jgi:hypothetical protein